MRSGWVWAGGPRHPLPSQRISCRDSHAQVAPGHNSPSGSVQQCPGALPRLACRLPRLRCLLSWLQRCSPLLATAQAVPLGLPGALGLELGGHE